MGFVYSSSKNAFFCDEFQASYETAGTWPGYFVRVSDEDYSALMNGLSRGQIVVTGKGGYPVLADRPALTQAELVSAAETERDRLSNQALQSISVIQFKQTNGRSLTPDETARLNRVLDYIDALDALDLTGAPDVSWPEVPGDVA